jgi:Domain of unknown function (DUF1877)
MGMVFSAMRVSNLELEKFQKESDSFEEEFYNGEHDEITIDLDKSWDGLHFLLTENTIQQSSHFLTQIFQSKDVLNVYQDMGYGPANYLDSSTVKELNSELQKISSEDLKSKYDPDLMNDKGIYPGMWNMEAWEYFEEYFMILKNFYKTASENDEAIIMFIS